MFAPATKAKAQKPTKPHKDSPLFLHKGTGRWCVKVKGKFSYFGNIKDDPKGTKAMERWSAEKDDILAGRKPRAKADGYVSVKMMCNTFLHSKKQLVESGELSQRTWDDYQSSCERLLREFGASRAADDVSIADFEALRATLADQYGPERLSTEIQKVRTIFKYAYEAKLIDKPILFGPMFKRPSAKVLRITRAERGLKMFEADEIRAIISEAGVPLKAMILLGINCGFGNSDVGNLPLSALDLDGGWLSFPRPKTGVARRCKLWPETIKALKAAIAARRTPKTDDANELVFITRAGTSWAKSTKDNPVMNETKKVLKALGLHREGVGFYALRHTFETIGGATKDQKAVDSIMGHVDASMSARYRERIDDERLAAVANHVHAWLFPPKKAKAVAKKPSKKSAKS